MGKASVLLRVLTCLLVGCSGDSGQSTREAYGPDELAAREARLEHVFLKTERNLGPENVRKLKQSFEAHRRARAEQEEALPELTKNKDYYRLQCEYTDSLTRMLEAADPGSTDRQISPKN